MKSCFLSADQLESLVQQYPTPFHLYDEAGIRKTAQDLHRAFSWNKGFKEYFAVKATPNPFILDILKSEGCGVDCSSYTELLIAEGGGFKGEDIMFSSNVTPDADFLKAVELGAIVNFDDLSHIDHFKNLVGTMPKLMSCRFNPGGVFKVSNDIMDHPQEAKYGFTKAQLFEGYQKLKQYGVEAFGIHAFLVSNAVTEAYYPKLAELLFQTIVEIHQQTGVTFRFVNLSGGIGIPYRPDQAPADIQAIGEAVRQAYEAILVPNGLGDVAIYTELGRYMLAPHGYLVSRVLHLKHTHKDYVGLDACAANLMRPAMYGAYHHITVVGKEDLPADQRYDVTGGLCENNDKFAIDRCLPLVEKGDLVVIHDTGAHGFAMGYNYNGKLRSAEVLWQADGTSKLIRRAETPADYLATFDYTHRYDDVLRKDRSED